MCTARDALVIAAFAVVLTGTVACTGSKPVHATPLSESVEVDGVTLRELNDGNHAFQLSLVSDSRLSRTNYDRLASTYRQCVTDAGATLTDQTMVDIAGNYVFDVEWPAGSEAAVHECGVEYWDPLGPLWSRYHQPTQDQIRDADDRLGECLREAGVDFPYAHPSLSDFHSLRDASGHPPAEFMECVFTVSKQVKIPGFGGG